MKLGLNILTIGLFAGFCGPIDLAQAQSLTHTTTQTADQPGASSEKPDAKNPVTRSASSVKSETSSNDNSIEALAKRAQNPLDDMVSVQFESDLNFRQAPYGQTRASLIAQPVIPIHLNERWNLIARPVSPFGYQARSSNKQGERGGLSDLNWQFFLANKTPYDVLGGKLTMGVGPNVLAPTATHAVLGNGRWGAGPSFLAVFMEGQWVMGGLLTNTWSTFGQAHADSKRVSRMSIQPFVVYNLKDGWYLATNPHLASDWTRPSNDRWTVPFGGSFGRVFKIEKQAVAASIGAYYNAIRPNRTEKWQMRLQFSLLFPD